jgi:hypothetical protein
MLRERSTATPTVREQPEDAGEETPRSEQTAEEKLKVAEVVMRKLYRKSLDLERQLREREQSGMQEQSTTVGGSGSDSDAVMRPRTAGDALNALSRTQKQGEQHFRFLLTQKNSIILDLQRQVASLQAHTKVVESRHGGGSKASSRAARGGRGGDDSAGGGEMSEIQLQAVMRDNERFRSNYSKIKTDYTHLLQLRASRVGDEAKGVIEQLESRLAVEEDQRQADYEACMTKLYSAEQQSCEQYVQKRLVEQQLGEVAKDVQRRDELEGRIDECVHAMFERLQQLELENAGLRITAEDNAKDGANNGAEAAASDGAVNGGVVKSEVLTLS